MLREELELVRAHARIIAKEEVAAMPKPEKSEYPLEKVDALVRRQVDDAVSPLVRRVQELEKKLRELPRLAPVSKEKKGR